MKKAILTTLLLILLPISVLLGQITFQKIYKAVESSSFGRAIECADGGYAYIASLNNDLDESYNILLTKTNMNGEVEWTNTYGGEYGDYGIALEELPGGGFILTGHTFSFGSSRSDIYVVRVDALGEEIWTKKFGGDEQEQPITLKVINKNEFLIAGFTRSFGEGTKDYFLLKIDDSGDVIWSKSYGKSDIDDLYSIELTSDNGILLAGGSGDFIAEGSNVNLVKTNMDGDTLWTKAYHNETAVSIPFSAIETADGGIVVAAFAGAGYVSEYYLIRTDAVGDTIWTKSYALTYCDDWPRSIRETPDGDFIITGYSGCAEGTFMTKIDSDGALLWSKQYPGYTNNMRVEITDDNGYLFMAMDQREEDYGNNVRLIKTDEEGLTSCDDFTIFITETTSRTAVMPGVVTINDCPWEVVTPDTEIFTPILTDSTVCIECDSISAGFDFETDYLDVDFTNESYAATSWSWDFGDGNTSDDQHPNHMYEFEGTYTVCLEAINPICGTHTVCRELTVEVDDAGIDENSLNNISIYPNPTTNKLNFQTVNDVTIKSVLMYSIAGAVVLNETINEIESYSVDIGHLANGIYVVEVLTSEGNKVAKIIRQ